MCCFHRRPLIEAVRAIVHNVRILTVLVMVAGVFGPFEMFGGVAHANDASDASDAREMMAACSPDSVERHKLRVRLVPAKGVPAEMLEPAMKEVVELWQPYDVDVEWQDEWVEGDTGPKPDLFVFFVDRELERQSKMAPTAVAWILFVEGSPRPLVNVSVGAARRLLNETRWLDERPVRVAPLSIQDRLIGTMIGRALAHEIGHYLLASSKHANDGLMKPLITPAEFVKAGRNHLKLVPDHVRALRTARLANCQLTASR
jgi:hypothetical protein